MKTYKTIKIENLHNFCKNPRHGIGTNEADTLKKLINAVGVQQMLNLAKDIAENGLIPGQQLIVVPTKNKDSYTVYEGNRRIAAVKMLLRPSDFLYIGPNNVRKLEELSRIGTIPKEFRCYVTDEKEALFIMERRHLGEDSGRGIKNWGAKEKGNFGVLQGKKETMSFLLDKYSKYYLDGFEITSLLPYTTLDRIFNKKAIKDAIGFNASDASTFTKERLQLVKEAASWVVEEAKAQEQTVTRLFDTKDDIERLLLPWIDAYLVVDGNNSKNSPVKTGVMEQKDVDGGKQNPYSKSVDDNRKRKNNRIAYNKLLFNDDYLNKIDAVMHKNGFAKKVHALANEMGELKINTTDYAIISVFRGLMEASTQYAAHKYKINYVEQDLAGNIIKLLDFFSNDAGKGKRYDSKEIKIIRETIKKSKAIDALNNYIHKDMPPNMTLIRDFWNTLKRYIIMCIEE